MEEKRFDLLREPWIRVLNTDATEVEVSIEDLFRDAHKIKALAGEMETQNAAVLRFLLSILITVMYRYDAQGEECLLNEEDHDAEDVFDRWDEYWDRGSFPADVIINYLGRFEERFWLIHPDRPFYQVAGLTTGTEYDTAMTMMGDLRESNNKATKHHFSLREGDAINTLSYPKTARWLIHYNAYAVNVKRDKNAGGTKLTSFVGRLGRLGFIRANGRNLFETLMLNATLLKDGRELWGVPRPIWEQEDIPTVQGQIIPVPDNLPELYTVPSRRMLLKSDGERITGYRAMLGSFYEIENNFNEQMTVWAKREDKKAKREYYIPLQHDPSIQAWREFPSIFDAAHCEIRPGLILWLREIERRGSIESGRSLNLMMAGQMYDGMRYLYTDSVQDSITLSYDLLLERGSSWIRLISEEIEKCRETAARLGTFANDLTAYVYGDKSRNKESLRSKLVAQYYYEIDGAFRKWLLSISAEDEDKEAKQIEWQKRSYYSAKGVAEKYLQDLGLSLFTRRNGNAPLEYLNKFLRGMRQVYPTIGSSQKGGQSE